MNSNIFRKSWLKNFIPTDHLLSVLLKDLQQTRVEVSLQRVVIFDPFLLHVGLDFGVPVPLFAFVLIAADVQVIIGKERGHLAQECFEKLVDVLACRIECRLKDSRPAFDRVWTRSTAKLGMANQPACAVTGNVKLGHDTYAAVASVRNDFLHLFLCVEV